MKTLRSMVEFVFEQGNPSNTDSQFADKVMAYAHLLSQKPNIGMFVPAVCENGVWRVLELPKENLHNRDIYYKDLEQYQQAQSKVIFKGCFVSEYQCTKPVDVKSITNGVAHFFWYNTILGWHLSKGIHTLEDLVKLNLEMV